MKDLSVTDFLKRLSEKTPTPGGGAVCALNGAIACAQLKMICEYTKNEEITANLTWLEDKIGVFLSLAQSDSDAFDKVSQAYRNGDEQQIDHALVQAAEVSIQVLKSIEEITDFCEKYQADFNKSLTADLIVVIANIKAGTGGAQAMIMTNLDSIKYAETENLRQAIKDSSNLSVRLDKLDKQVGAD